MVRLLVVGDELRCVRLNLAASGHLADEEVTNQNGHTQLLPARRLVPLAMLKVLVALAVTLPLIIRESTDTRCESG
ncbi:Hypothetical protein RG1141_CH01580 [Neorhizobium galegae bv. officinalis bv. officinalis str. HAMBI 1141]|uniref:Uncharacterized protein n=1 Tax=Neorhizobium galegae bv. officinalis bv. officinalis str. HAMBI 1141 TaxID=1028801 RepID=A0A068T2A4_NEOGA|nr:Hypothetical protein RG1141_CH01580 [Neorhizobium galegae bv. officinalis bv. officinalis str. HAMBI 1141]